MKKSVARFVLFGALVAAQSAGAADLSVAPLYNAPPPQVAPPVYNWTGFYVGANGGGAWGNSWWQSQSTQINLSGAQAGGTAGYNRQFGNAVLGLEGDVDWSNLSGTSGSTLCPGCSTSDSWLSTVRGRAGYAIDRWLPYVTAGLAVGDIGATVPGLPGGSITTAGWTVGAGLEVGVIGNVSVKAEYLYVGFGSFNCGLNCGLLAGGNVSYNTNVLRAGLNVHF